MTQPNAVVEISPPRGRAVRVGNALKLSVIAGPCQLESRQHALETAHALREVAERLDIRQNRMAHASEIVEQVGAGKFRYAEHPVHILYTDYSRAKGQSMLNSVNILTEMFFK